MKRLMLISVFFSIASAGFAQTECNTGNTLFKFDNAGEPKTITTLGSNPEFPFLRNMSSSRQVYAVIKKSDDKAAHPAEMSELNKMLNDIGLSGGVKDLQPSSITEYYIPPGTTGNMGSGGYTSSYAILTGGPKEFKAWKISGTGSCYVYILAKCGNAFYPGKAHATACLDVPVSIKSESREVTLGNAQQKQLTDKTYIYYHKKHGDSKYALTAIPDSRPSKPLLLSETKRTETVPETYKVTVNTPDSRVKVCEDKELDVTANIDVEKISAYTGYYPDKSKTQYKQVSKRVYKKSLKKIYKAERKEEKVAYLTGVPVQREEVSPAYPKGGNK